MSDEGGDTKGDRLHLCDGLVTCVPHKERTLGNKQEQLQYLSAEVLVNFIIYRRRVDVTTCHSF